MFTSITWKEYLIVATIASFIYYVIIIVSYYKNEILDFYFEKIRRMNDNSENQFLSKTQRVGSPLTENHIREERTMDEYDDNNEGFRSISNKDDNEFPGLITSVHEMMDELKSVFEAAVKKDYIKEELMMALKATLLKYPQIQNAAIQLSLKNFIETESKNKCFFSLSEDELKVVLER